MCVVFQKREFEEDTLEVLEALPRFMKSQEVQDTTTEPKLQVNTLFVYLFIYRTFIIPYTLKVQSFFLFFINCIINLENM